MFIMNCKILRTEIIIVFLSCLIDSLALVSSSEQAFSLGMNFMLMENLTYLLPRCIFFFNVLRINFVFNLSYQLIYSASIRDTEVNLLWAVSVVSRSLLRDLISWCKSVKAELCCAVISLPPAYITSFKTNLDILQSIAVVPRDIPFV